jgi:tripartite-type tricarboxylate transporter receptor subunit TctC
MATVEHRNKVTIENVGGAGGMTGTARVATAAPDGYQFTLGSVDTMVASNQPPPAGHFE